MSSNLFNQLTSLSPGQRALFEQKLAQRGLKVPTTQIPKRQVAQPPLSFAQQRLWFIQQLDPASVAYNVASVLRLTGALDVPVLELTLSALVERHETLRTSFERVDGEPVQVVHPAEPVALPVVDLKQIAQTPEDWIAALTQQPFDLTQPLLRLALLRLDEQTHLLAIATHHIISDRWSVMVFLREMTVLYNAFLRGERSPLPPLPIQYGDYAAWQRQQGTHLQKQIAYWKDKLGGELPVLELPYDRPQSASPTYKGAQYPIALSPKLSAALKDLSARSSVTLFTLLLTAFKVLLHRYSDQDDILVGSDVANRDRVETEGLIGLLVNTLVLRSDLSGNPRFGDLLAQVRETVLGALAHQDVPFEKLVEVLNPERHLSQMMPLFQAKLDLQQVRVQPLALSGITLERHPLPEASAKYELRFNLQDTAQGISGQVEYSTDLFDEGTIARMVGHFQTLLAGIVADPTLPLSELPLLSQAEQQQLSAWNQTQQDFPSGCIHHLFEAQAKRTPKATALIWNGDRFSYGELNRRAEGLAHRLVDLGVGLEVPVGVCMARSADMVVGLLAILKAGGAYVPLDPAYPAERLALIVADARISVLLCDGDLPFDGDGITAIDPAAIGGDRISAINPSGVVRATGRLPLPLSDGDHPTIAPHNLAYIIYTSGSTGTPKGVAIEHCSTVAMLHWAKTRFSPAELSGVLAATSICFDLSVFEIFAPLSWGGCVVLAESALVLPKLPAAEAVTLLNTVPSALAELLNINGLPPSVQTVNIAGEALPPALVHRLRQLSHIQRVYNLYGPSEDTTYSTWADVSQLDSSVSRSPIGRPIANTQAYVCDRAGRPVPIGVAGELYLGGAGVARGYLGRPGLTAERFLPNAFNAGAHGNTSNSISRLDGRKGIQPYAPTNVNGVLYKTGDRVRYRADGALEFLGRLDHQVKIRGFRIETGEIEAALAQCPGVKEAVVVAESREGSARLVAYVVLQGVTPADLKAYLAQRLPGYMLPGQIVELEALPRLPNGKVNRRALPEPQIERDAIAFVAPGTLTEAAIADVWRQALTLEAVSIHDNFFDLGGHSLLGMRVIAQLEQALGREVPLKALFQTPTIAGLAAQIDAAQLDATATSLPTIDPNPDARHEPFPLTDIQQAYWLGRSQAFDLGNVATHGYREIETVGLSVAQVAAALRSLIQRHPMLRAVITPDGQQRVLPEVPPYEIRVSDLRQAAPEQQQVALTTLRDRLSHEIHDAERWPLFTLEAAQLDGERVRFCVSFDALIGDAWSFRLLGWEMAQLLRGQSLPALTLTFRDYVLAEQDFRRSPKFQKALDYWQARLPELPSAPDLPLLTAPPQKPTFVRRSGRLEASAWSALKQKARQAGLTPAGALLAAFSEVLTPWSRQPRFTLNLTLFNRLPLHPEVNQIVGDFTSSLLLVVDNAKEGSFAARAKRLQAQLWEDLEHRAVSGVRVLRELAKTRQGGALMPVVFTSTLNQSAPDGGDRPWDTDVVYGLSQTSQVYLDHQVSEVEGALVFNWDAIADLFPPGLLDDMFAAYEGFLQRLAEEADAWEETPRLSPMDHVAALNGTDTQLFSSQEPLLHQLFLEQAEHQPHHSAVIAGDRTLTYGELRQRVLNLAQRLQDLGVGPNQLVAVSMEKGWEPVVAVLGILAAGAAYVPIDPNWPQERRWHLIQDTQAAALLTQNCLGQLDWPDSLIVLTVDADALNSEPLNAASPHPPISPPQPTDLAYVIYTSGSTGTPKGVMIDHRGAVNTVLDINRRFEVGPSDRVLALSALSFDLSVYDIFGTLAAGATLVMPDAEGDRDPAHWVYLLNAHGVTLWNSVPALMQLFLAELEAHPDCGRSLRLALLSGDWLPLPLPEQIRRAFSAARTVSLGGATEASIWSVAYPIEAVDPDWRSIPYGRPLVNQQWYVLDENLQPCPVWVPGQLYIGGRGVAQGYWNRPELTADRFIAIPHSVGAQGPAPLPVPQISTNANGRSPRLYKTGDLGRYRPDGTLEFLGREDFQVKVNGYRIELGEIEAALTQHPAIREAVVEAVGEASQSQQLVAYIVPEDGGPSTPDTALNHPLARLAFKQERRGLRDLPDEPTSVTLPLPAAPPDFRRQSYRQFLPGPIDLATFSQFLSGLKSAQVATSPLPKYRYASAGSLYPVQTYLYIKPQRIDGVEAGFYYYHPADHQLVRLDEQDIDLDGLYGSNQAIAEQAAFSLFLVANLEAIAPLYPKKARDFCLLEAGYMSQLLMDSAPGTGLGLCPLGKFGPGLQQALALGESHEVLHGLAGGAINPAWTQQWQILEAPQADSPASLPEKLRQFLAEKLPTYMVPTTYQMLDALPLSANGKVDRKALPIPSSLSAPAPYAPPRTDTERAIAAIWQEVLSLEQVGIHANFFEAGGNSLSAMQAVSQLRQVFPVELSIRQFFTAQTLAEQAVVVDALRTGAPSADPLVPAAIQPASESEPQALLNQLDDLSEQDVDALLSQMLSEEDS